jgi:GNAT superfamily N-acetyltransferase
MIQHLVERLTWADEPAAVDTLATAFADYPLFPPLCPNPLRRPAVIQAFCRFLYRTAVRNGGAYGTADRTAVVCSWPVGSEWSGLWNDIRSGGLSLAWQIGWHATRLLLQLGNHLNSACRKHVPEAHCYVPLLAVRPEAQGQGLSRVVLQIVFNNADYQKVPVYLETMKEANVVIYQRLGFELVGYRIVAGGLPNWEFLRKSH